MQGGIHCAHIGLSHREGVCSVILISTSPGNDDLEGNDRGGRRRSERSNRRSALAAGDGDWRILPSLQDTHCVHVVYPAGSGVCTPTPARVMPHTHGIPYLTWKVGHRWPAWKLHVLHKVLRIVIPPRAHKCGFSVLDEIGLNTV